MEGYTVVKKEVSYDKGKTWHKVPEETLCITELINIGFVLTGEKELTVWVEERGYMSVPPPTILNDAG